MQIESRFFTLNSLQCGLEAARKNERSACQILGAWIFILVVLGTIHAQYADATAVDVNVYMYPIGATILLSPLLLIQFYRLGYFPVKWILILSISYYALVFLQCFVRDNSVSEFPRAIIMGAFICAGLSLGAVIGSSDALIKTLLTYSFVCGCLLIFFAVIFDYGVVSFPNSFKIERTNRFFITLFGVIDPPTIFTAGFWFYIRDNDDVKRKLKVLLIGFISLLLLITVTRQYYIMALIVVGAWGLSKIDSPRLRGLLVIVAMMAGYISYSGLSTLESRPGSTTLENLRLVDANGDIIEDPRVALSQALYDVATENPWLGVGMNGAKNYAWYDAGSSARTEHGYVVHLAAFGFIIPLPFFLIMLIGGIYIPLYSIINLPSAYLKDTAPLFGAAIAITFSGFVGSFGTATSISSLFSLVYVGLGVSLAKRAWGNVHIATIKQKTNG